MKVEILSEHKLKFSALVFERWGKTPQLSAGFDFTLGVGGGKVYSLKAAQFSYSI